MLRAEAFDEIACAVRPCLRDELCGRALTDPVALLAGTVGTTITRRGIRAGANDALALTGAANQKGREPADDARFRSQPGGGPRRR
jgi:hypothetical protein